MKTKHLLITLLLALMVPWAAQAQSTLPLYENAEANNQYVPFYGWYGDEVQTDQMIYPADQLTAMVGKQITKMVFYWSSDYGSYALCDWNVSLGTTTATTLNGLNTTTSLSQVYSGPMDFDTDAKTMTIEFDEAFVYNGDNLLVQFHNPVTSTTSYHRYYFLGVEATGASYCYGSQQNFLPRVTFTYENPPACPKPSGLTVNYTGGTTATATWTGTADTYNIDINGTVTNDVTSPYQFTVELATTYTVKVQAACGSDWTNPVNFTTDACMPVDMCEIHLALTDSYGDGWNGNTLQVIDVATQNVLGTYAGVSHGGGNVSYTDDFYLSVCNGSEIQFVYVKGAGNYTYPDENSFVVYDVFGEIICQFEKDNTGPIGFEYTYTMSCTPPTCPKPTNLTNGTPTAHEVLLSWTENGSAERWQICVNGDEGNLLLVNENPYTLGSLIGETDYTVKVRAYCDEIDQSSWSNSVSFTTDEACPKPTNLKEENITINSATLSWTGTNDSYVLQYRPWYPAGNDITTTGTMTPYVVDLSAYTGIGAVAIRHYDVSDMFQLIVDDIVVTNAANEVVFSEDFESCDGNMPAAFTNMDLDGDGYEWGIASSPSSNVNGSYGIVSASYDNDAGALFPDNWLIISGLEMGGQMIFYARGQDANWAAENFAIYVSTESSIVEVPLTATSYLAENLTPNTPYAWQVKGITGVEESIYVSSFFKTLDDLLVFATDGDWDVLANWTDVEGNNVAALPTKENNVRIDADATIPAGVVAEVNKANINGGSITIEEGGQLKHASASLSVTLNKGITGYSAEKDHYYFISTPFSGVTLVGSTTWSHINNITDNEYDLYGFDATNVGEEWINWKSSPGSFDVFVSGNNTGLKPTYGYLYANSEDVDLEFVGTAGPTNTNPVYSVTYDMTSTDPWNGFVLVGNPFTCNAYVTFAPASGTPSEIDFYVMNDEGDGYTLSATNVTLAPMQGAFFWSDIDGDVTFSSEAPAGGKSALLNMSLSQNRGSVDQARVRFGQGHNLKHMSFRQNSSKLYIPQDNDYAVVYSEENQGEMPVSFKAEKNGTYTLSFSTENVEFGYLHLIDNLTGNDVDLLATPSYSFEARTTDYASRFTLVFATGNAEDNFAFFSNGSFVINNEGNATLQVVDVMGRIISSEAINGCTNLNMNAAPGVYMLRLVNGNDVKVQKVVVR